MYLIYFLFFFGFFILIKGADFLVKGSVSLAQRLGVSKIAVGLSIVAFGTSSPELVVNILASFRGNTDIAIGNILGSNICNILLVLGLAALVHPLVIKKSTTWKEIPFSFLAVVVLVFLANDQLIDKLQFSSLTRIDGLVLLSFFIIFLYYLYGISKVDVAEEKGNKGNNKEEGHPDSLTLSFLKILGGVILLFFGGKWVVEGAVVLASHLGVSEALIGLTIVAVGTSLPELATSVVAIFKREMDISVGNIVGSNIFNIFFVLGISTVIRPLPFSTELIGDLGMTLFVTFLLFITMFIGKKHILERWQGGFFVLLYIVYITYLIVRG